MRYLQSDWLCRDFSSNTKWYSESPDLTCPFPISPAHHPTPNFTPYVRSDYVETKFILVHTQFCLHMLLQYLCYHFSSTKIVYPLATVHWQKIQLKRGRFTRLLFSRCALLWTPDYHSCWLLKGILAYIKIGHQQPEPFFLGNWSCSKDIALHKHTCTIHHLHSRSSASSSELLLSLL